MGNDDDEHGPSYSTVTLPKAKKQHQCCECRLPILPGAVYENTFGLWDGPLSFKTCLLCAELRDHFNRDGWIYGELWEGLREGLYANMTCGGQCMAGLSPVAKARLIDERMNWYLAQDEIDDSKWKNFKGA